MTTWTKLSPLELRPSRLLTFVTSKPLTPLHMPQQQGQHTGMQTLSSGGSGQGAETGSVFAVVTVDNDM